LEKVLVILENDDVAGKQNLSLVTKKLIGNRINRIRTVRAVVLEPIGGFPPELPAACIGIIVGGGLPSVNDPKEWIKDEIKLIRQAVDLKLPILGICFGHQLIAKAFGSAVVRREKRVGFADIVKVKDAPIFAGLPETWRAPVYHRDRVEELPHGFELIATSNYCKVQAMAHKKLPIFTVQFHPEISYGINSYFADPVMEWSDKSAFEDAPNRRLVYNFVDMALASLGMKTDE
jgi:GMP synthase-like glutamine amidotransferase